VGPDEVTVKIEGQTFRYWESIRILSAIDAITRVEFVTPFEPEHKEFRDIFRPLSFRRLTVSIGGELYFTGRMGTIVPNVQPNRSAAVVPCFAEPGMLETPNIPASLLPSEFKGLNLLQIAETLAAPFGIRVVMEGEPGDKFKKVAVPPTSGVLGWLAGLAQQRGYVMSDTTPGELLFRQSVPTGNPVGRLVQGQSPLVAITPNIREGQYFSDITGIKPAKSRRRGSQYTVTNPFVLDFVRPSNFIVSDADGGDPETATRAKMGRMFGNVANWSTRIATWRAPNNALWSPNTTLKVTASKAMIYNEYEFLTRTIDLRAAGRLRTATVGLVMPGAFSGEVPESMPWDE
jgi:prophage tail gpP-like protein